MAKQLLNLGYWLGLISTVLAVFFRFLAAAKIFLPHMAMPGGNALSYLTFLHGGALFFLLAIASWCKGPRS